MDNEIIEHVSLSVQQAFEELIEVSKSLDLDGYLDLIHQSDFTALNPDGTVTLDFALFAQSYKAQTAACKQYHSLEFSNVKITPLSPTTAILVNEFSARIELDSGDVIDAKGAGTQVWQLIDRQWKLAHISSSAKP